MVGKQNTFFRDAPCDQIPLGGSGSLGNYNRGRGGKNDFNCRNTNNNAYGNAHAAPQDDKNYNRFQKFRDPHSFERQKSSRGFRREQQRERRRERRREERRGNGRDGGYQNYPNPPRKDGLQWFDNSVGTKPLQGDRPKTPVEVMQQPHDQQQQQPKDHPPVANSTATTVPAASEISTEKAETLNVATKDPAVNVLEQQQIIKNIKQEKVVNEVTKQIIKPPPSSSSSSSSDSSDNENTATSKASPAAIKTKIIKAEPVAKDPPKKSLSSSTSSSSSSSSEEEDESDKPAAKALVANVIKSTKTVVKKKKSSEDDLICLGKLEKKFVIEDDASEEADVSEDILTGKRKNICLICDKEGHTAFECQMICKNCSTPYHNMKSCPKPANLSIVMQSFMEFCMGQMNQFNPEQKFILPSYINGNENKLTKEAPVAASKKSKKTNVKSKEPRKKLIKRKRKRSTKSSDEEEDDDEDVKKDETEEELSTESESESESSTEEIVAKSKKKRAKTPSVSSVDPTEFPKAFIPPFSNFPSFGAAAAAYNPLLLSQLMHAGNFGTPKKLNFQ